MLPPRPMTAGISCPAATSPGGGGQERPRRRLLAARRSPSVRPGLLLGTEQSAALRERLLAGLGRLQSADEAAEWVHANLAAKNTLIAADADRVESGFRDRLTAMDAASSREADPQSAPAAGIASPVETAFPCSDGRPSSRLRSSCPQALAHDADAWRRRPFACATRSTASSWPLSPASSAAGRPSEAHHIRFAQPRALGRKVSDEYTVPVCRLHHRELHRYGDEASWWAGVSIDPLPIALELWRRSRSTTET